ncbi:hypothetical protein MCON_2745 [Methanothrix soehngenii GP6]|uniref:Uncharacterized protein n=1 Tax=Methanothrix soehngenii (strain ATCC 5969 / DSM 3671 / JCM 10134 / NBRC 103675 / OCM 69 / GP-6) TaxID=990316 RepID=F4BZZ2_METSG|nr:hypothetical protein MCON_2745 [Methanothrix soehngenii GP6]
MVSTKSNDVSIICHRLISCITIAAFLIQANADAADPLDPGQLGESMSMPLPQELLLNAVKAGVIADSDSLDQPDISETSISVRPKSEAEAFNPAHINVTGNWLLNLYGASLEQMELYLFQKDDAILGQGAIIRGDGRQNATASGSISGDEMSLVVVPSGSLDMYQLNLSLSTLGIGSYTTYMTNGSSRSGELAFTATTNIFKPVSHESSDRFDATPAPVQLSGSAGSDKRISSKTAISMMDGGGSMSQATSSSSF